MTLLHIQDHVFRARQEPTTENLEALWKSVFMLKAWYFLPASNAEGPSYPTIANIDGTRWLLAFTNHRRIKEFAAAAGRVTERGDVFLLVLDPLQSVERAGEIQEHVDGVIFNIDSEEMFRTSIEGLLGFARHFGLDV